MVDNIKNKIAVLKKWGNLLKKNPKCCKWIIPWWWYQNKSSVECELPWMSFDAISYLKKNMNNDFHIFEWGSGGSTLFFASRVEKVHSIEYDFEWFNQVTGVIGKNGIQNIDYEFIKSKSISNISDVKDEYLDNKPPHNSFYWDDYVCAIDKFNNNNFDVIVVDGRARPGCILHSVFKLKSAGLLVVDNSERAAYQKALASLDKWSVFHFYGPVIFDSRFSRTSVYHKP